MGVPVRIGRFGELEPCAVVADAHGDYDIEPRRFNFESDRVGLSQSASDAASGLTLSSCYSSALRTAPASRTRSLSCGISSMLSHLPMKPSSLLIQ